MRASTSKLVAVVPLLVLACAREPAPVAPGPSPDEPVVNANAEPSAVSEEVEEPEQDEADTVDSRLRPISIAITPELRSCEQDWLFATTPPPAELTRRCMELYLAYGYGGSPSEGELDYDPYYGSPIELRYTGMQLRRMGELVDAICKEDQGVSRCERASEFLWGMAARKRELYDDVNVDGIEGALATILAGERLGDSELWLDHDLGFSELMLWKLEAGVAARHGQPFADEDLDAFFYSDRSEQWAELGLPALKARPDAGEPRLSEADHHNLALVARAQARARGELAAGTHCYRGDRVVFFCELVGGDALSLCGSDTATAPRLDWAFARVRQGGELWAAPGGLIDAVAEHFRYGQVGDQVVVELHDPGYGRVFRVERSGGEARRSYAVTLSDDEGVDQRSTCAQVGADDLDAIGEAIPRRDWLKL